MNRIFKTKWNAATQTYSVCSKLTRLAGKVVGCTVLISAVSASAGESQPVTTNCVGNRASKALTECLQPDRRVTVEINGVEKGKK